jgi:hypothetical protein
MIEQNFDEALPPDWVKANIRDVDNELVILRQVIPWQSVLDKLVSFYSPGKGRVGKSLRTMVALLIVSRLRQLSDKQVVGQVKEIDTFNTSVMYPTVSYPTLYTPRRYVDFVSDWVKRELRKSNQVSFPTFALLGLLKVTHC